MRYIVFDLEASCWKNPMPHYRQEIIEIGACAINRYGEKISVFSQFVKPILHPFLSPYCLQLTGITQENIDKAKKLEDVLENFLEWCEFPDESCTFFAWGNADRQLLLQSFEIHNLNYDFIDHYVDLKSQYMRLKSISKSISLDKAIEKENLEWHGNRHRALDDAINLSKIFAIYMDHWKY